VPAGGTFQDRIVRDLPDYLRPGDALVVNDSRVIHARLSGRRFRGALSANVEATLIERLDASRWRALMRPAKKLAIGDRISFMGHGGEIDARVEAKGDEGEITLAFELRGPALDIAIEQAGVMPLPPYIAGKRSADARDERDYQTIFAREAGAVAAPTAGLHFTPQLLAAIEARGVQLYRVTLHVGAGTFLPVKAEDTDLHRMHEEFARLDAESALACKRRDLDVDAEYEAIQRQNITYMMEDPRNITFCIHLMFCAKNIERMGDHATNIAETVHYMVEGRPIADQRPKGDTTAFAKMTAT